MKAVAIGLISVVVAAGLLVGGFGWWNMRAAEAANRPAMVWTLELEPGELVEVATAPGTVEPQERVSISARVSARIAEIRYRAGDVVTRGDPATDPTTHPTTDPAGDPPLEPSLLVRLDAAELEAALRSAEANRAAQQAQLEVNQTQIRSRGERIEGMAASLREARLALARQRDLLASRHASQAAVDQAESRVDELEASLAAERTGLEADRLALNVLRHNLEAAEAEVARARDNLSYATIHSPIDGVVTRVNAKVGEIAVTGTMNNPGTVILEVADLSTMLVAAEVGESDVTRVEPGQAATVEIMGYRGEQFAGEVATVALVNSTGGEGGRYYQVAIVLDAGDRRILSGLSANVAIETQRHADVLKVPSQAVLGRRVDDLPREVRQASEHVDTLRTLTPVVYRLVDGQAVATPVTLGPSDATHTIIRGGLEAGERVIIGPYRVLEQLRHGQPVLDEAEAEADEGSGGSGA